MLKCSYGVCYGSNTEHLRFSPLVLGINIPNSEIPNVIFMEIACGEEKI